VVTRKPSTYFLQLLVASPAEEVEKVEVSLPELQQQVEGFEEPFKWVLGSYQSARSSEPFFSGSCILGQLPGLTVGCMFPTLFINE
jgi:hypothetical protein